MEPIFELALSLPGRGSRELLRSLHAQLRAAIVDGRLKPGLRLPPSRELASANRISRNTVVAAYDLLLTEGYLSARRGAGTFVAESLPRAPEGKLRRQDWRAMSAGASGGARSVPRALNPFWRSSSPLERTASTSRFDFRVGKPDKRHFPFDVWRRLYARALRALAKAPVASTDPHGRERLRAAIARHVSLTRAVACGPEDIIVTSGAQQAFDLLARVLVTAGRTTVAIENPGYRQGRIPFAAAGAKLAPVPVDSEGMIVSQLAQQARVVCVTPSHQFPLGCVLSMERRVALLEFARTRGAVVIEDDYDGEFRFGGRPLDALQTLDRAESVFYVGTFSKSLFPGIRVGFIVAPSWAREALLAAKECADGQSPVVIQEALADFIAEGHLGRHVRRMRQVYGARRAALLEGIQRMPRPWLEPVPSSAGLHVAAFTSPGADADAVVRRALEQGVGLRSISEFYVGKAKRAGLVFGLGLITEDEIGEALGVLSRLRRK